MVTPYSDSVISDDFDSSCEETRATMHDVIDVAIEQTRCIERDFGRLEELMQKRQQNMQLLQELRDHVSALESLDSSDQPGQELFRRIQEEMPELASKLEESRITWSGEADRIQEMITLLDSAISTRQTLYQSESFKMQKLSSDYEMWWGLCVKLHETLQRILQNILRSGK